MFQVGIGSVLIALTYDGAIWLFRRYDSSNEWVPVDLPDPEPLSFPAPFAFQKQATGVFSDRLFLPMGQSLYLACCWSFLPDGLPGNPGLVPALSGSPCWPQPHLCPN